MAICEELAQKLHLLQNQFAHVHDPDRLAEIAEEIGEIAEQQRLHGCLDSVTRTLNCTATLWTDSSFIPGPKTSQRFGAIFRITTATGDVVVVFSPPTIQVGSAAVSLQRPGTGNFAQSTGSLDIHLPLLIKGVPLSGDLSTDMFLWTGGTISTVSGVFAGSPLDGAGNVTLVGTAPVSTVGGTINAQLRVVGVLGPAVS